MTDIIPVTTVRELAKHLDDYCDVVVHARVRILAGERLFSSYQGMVHIQYNSTSDGRLPTWILRSSFDEGGTQETTFIAAQKNPQRERGKVILRGYFSNKANGDSLSAEITPIATARRYASMQDSPGTASKPR